MTRKPKRLANCPVCTEPLLVTRLACPHCQISIDGQFGGSKLGLLSQEQQEFVEVFLACGGNIRAVEAALAISYPTVKKRLEGVVRALGSDVVERARRSDGRDEILKKIENGVLTAKEGARLLKQRR